ncbi:MAG: glycerophosphoryl diester phosphodiesterase membrane domain-containing protein [Candidatus Diapherotrites archaeon]|nr:glycerophosphoryl diester phosphodiesterase membrane domain-containing protein [Candidatus Diapherotrites archaeon]
MIGSFVGAAKALVKKPALLLPAIGAVIIFLALFFVFAPTMVGALVDTLVLGELPEVPLNFFPFYFSAMYAEPLLLMLVFAVLVALTMLSASYAYAAYVRIAGKKGGAGVGEACRETIGALGKILGLLVFAMLVIFLVSAALWGILLLALASAAAAALLAIVAALLVFFVYVKLSFTLQAMAMDEAPLREALQASWRFSNGRFWAILVFLFILAVINNVILNAGFGLSGLVLLDDNLGIAVGALFMVISIAYAGIAAPLYYQRKKKGK